MSAEERCLACGGLNGAHGLVHRRNAAGGGGSNLPCPLAPATLRAEARFLAAALWQVWRHALRRKEAAADDNWERADQEEQDAYDRLVDFIEVHDLNWCEYDPRYDDDEEPELAAARDAAWRARA